MFGGLFQLTLDSVVNTTISAAGLNHEQELRLRQDVQPAISGANLLGYMLTSMFIWYFSLYRPASSRGRVAVFVAKLLVLVAYVPIVIYCGGLVDGCIMIVAISGRFLYVGYYAICYRSFAFILHNVTTLCYLNGVTCPYSCVTKFADYVAFYGGHHYISIGAAIVDFVHRDSLYVAIRGRKEMNLYLSKALELSDGAFIYLFTNAPIVGVYNTSFEMQESQLNHVFEDC
ncbi:nonstructural protein NS3 [Rhinolophus affinis bat coronavirus HKU2-related]|nr:nonstructural protein NS3 [Rhinolophus affinis bat coronavirus HKU2-related]